MLGDPDLQQNPTQTISRLLGFFLYSRIRGEFMHTHSQGLGQENQISEQT